MITQEDENDINTIEPTELHEEILEEPIGSEAHIIEPLEEVEGAKRELEGEETKIQESKSRRKKAPKSEVAKKRPARTESEAKSKLESELRKHSDASKKTNQTIKDIQRQIKELNKKAETKHHQVVRDLQAQIRELQIKIDRIYRSIKSSKSKGSAKKTISGMNGTTGS
ncbi:MAG TPA: hypothetical protein VF884_11165 [Nitrososphaeraceae archaeon]